MIEVYRDNLELIILSILKKRACYGYEIISFVSKDFSINSNSVYPLLKKLSQEKLIDHYLQESNEGAPRKYYELNSTGELVYKELMLNFCTLYSYLTEDHNG